MQSPLLAPLLRGSFVRLEPLSVAHVPGIAAASSGDRSTFAFGPVPGGEPAMMGARDAATTVTERLALAATGTWIPFVQVRVADNTVVGMTNYLNVERWNGPDQAPTSVEIGGTWLCAEAQRTPINTEAKLLLLTHAFETWNVVRVQIKTDARNERSRNAILRIGATFEGVLRNYQLANGDAATGAPRDTAFYSVIDAEWAGVKERLLDRLS
jgi:N-acetyltransferase